MPGVFIMAPGFGFSVGDFISAIGLLPPAMVERLLTSLVRAVHRCYKDFERTKI